MTREEFEVAFEAMRAKLDAAELDMLDRIIAGSAVNHSVVYALIAFALGVVGGLAAAGLWW